MDKTEKLLNTANESLLTITKRPNVIIDKGKGMHLWDTNGTQYLDFIGGWAVCCLGHSPKVISEALAKQSMLAVNSSPSFYNTPMLEYTELLVKNSAFDRVWFGNSGAEVNEAAIKLARKYGKLKKNGAYEIITTKNSFHGRTLATMSATGKDHWQALFDPKPKGFVHVPFNDIEAIKKAINKNTVAVMLEPVQGEGGVNPASIEYIQELRELCTKNNILLIFDEVQTGFGRTGTLFCYEQYGIEPDIMTLAKGIGGGFPLSAILVKEYLNIFDYGDQGGTFGGQQLAMAVGKAVLNEFLEKDILANVVAMNSYIMEQLNSIKDKFKLTNIRGKGLLIGFDIPGTNGQDIVKNCLGKGLIINSPKPSTIRLMPPLIVSKEDINEMMVILKESLL